ncbi:deoxyribodipyrimidine photo-lyase [Actimicrobium sp. GrIS 1.19]|uniref:cryptochrome/photolyase family protein n=1 Tax=Actimicrobium sp. GrIS 1.19 TaxID=3071708 RepID=UPI002E07C307|nr:deoxyribodipyrimidine photo-lyase [Actimicrobium sp. GrIS 1.19]
MTSPAATFTFERALVWFRRDLRLFDHAALHHALKQSRAVFCVFVFDKEILDRLPRQDRRVEFLHACLMELHAELQARGGALIVRHASAADEVPRLARELQVDAVFINQDYEPQAIARDAAVAHALRAHDIDMQCFKDQVIFEKNEVLSLAGKPFSVFTPYKNAWLKQLQFESSDFYLKSYAIEPYAARLACSAAAAVMPTLDELGFEPSNFAELKIPTGMSGGHALAENFFERIDRYRDARDFPAVKGPSYLSVHLRFGTISVRYLARRACEAARLAADAAGAQTWLGELIWRDFYFMILHHHPHVVAGAFKPDYDAIAWETGVRADADFAAWCEGRTGYPLVDAAMAQLNRSGYMHNRLRMVTACFLIKDLGIDWRRGEAYFAEKLIDFDLAANNGGWQWASSSGCDAQPYFRIFNPITQSEKFDERGQFIRRYLPQLARLGDKQIHAPWLLSPMELAHAGIVLGQDYPAPIVQHDVARKRTLQRYAVVKKVATDAAA